MRFRGCRVVAVVSGMACCACGRPLVIQQGFFTLAKFEVDVPHGIERDRRQAICRGCCQAAVAAWALKSKGKTRPRLVL